MADRHPLFTFRELAERVAPGAALGEKRWKLVRHKHNSEHVPDLIDLFHFDRTAFEFYQADQSSHVFRDCEGFFSFLGLPGGRGLFVGAYAVGEARQVRADDLLGVPACLQDHYKEHPERGISTLFRYELVPSADFAPLELRAVIDWGASMRSWQQWKLDKPVVELRDPSALPECPALQDIEISLAKIAFLLEHEDANSSWRDKLSSVGGIYLLTDHKNSRLYVGQAGGSGGFWNRWKAYARLRSGNVALDPAFEAGHLDRTQASLSILEVVPSGAMNKTRLNELESRWKQRLCSRVSGYNRN
ncbi:MAG: hypothetical protein H6716_22905 [Polyangiaceae bacterium]|nr:hypothetical protein [Polyangiaceae bacterium]